MVEDKVNIGLSIEANKVANILEEAMYFDDRLTIAKFALAYAVKNGFDSNISDFKIGDAGGTKWNVGSVDNDQYLKDLIISIYPESETPYRFIEALMNNGLLEIGKIIDSEGLNKISKFM